MKPFKFKQEHLDRKTFQRYETLMILINYLLRHPRLPRYYRLYFYFFLLYGSPRRSKSLHVNVCCVTSRRASVLSVFSLSRLVTRRYGAVGWIPGLIKDSW